MPKTALITGVKGQDGAYLAQFLIAKGYNVIGTSRNEETKDNWRLSHLGIEKDIIHATADLLDENSILNVLETYQPDEVYNLAAMSAPGGIYKLSAITKVNALGVTTLLDGIKQLKADSKFFQASSCQIFGNAEEIPQTENTLFAPTNVYGTSKLYGHLMCKNTREADDFFACSGILFNHESPLRGANFVSRKITKSVVEIALGLKEKLSLGNVNVSRDWGFAGDYVKAMWLMLQQAKADDYVIASGKIHTLKYLVETAFKQVDKTIVWEGVGIEEVGRDSQTGKTLVDVSPAFFRPTEIFQTLGNIDKAKNQLSWQPETSFQQMIEMMIKYEFDTIKNTQN